MTKHIHIHVHDSAAALTGKPDYKAMRDEYVAAGIAAVRKGDKAAGRKWLKKAKAADCKCNGQA